MRFLPCHKKDKSKETKERTKVDIPIEDTTDAIPPWD